MVFCDKYFTFVAKIQSNFDFDTLLVQNLYNIFQYFYMGQRLKLIRKALGMTQEQLAQRLGVGKTALSMVETGKANLSNRNKNILVQELIMHEFCISSLTPV